MGETVSHLCLITHDHHMRRATKCLFCDQQQPIYLCGWENELPSFVFRVGCVDKRALFQVIADQCRIALETSTGLAMLSRREEYVIRESSSSMPCPFTHTYPLDPITDDLIYFQTCSLINRNCANTPSSVDMPLRDPNLLG